MLSWSKRAQHARWEEDDGRGVSVGVEVGVAE